MAVELIGTPEEIEAKGLVVAWGDIMHAAYSTAQELHGIVTETIVDQLKQKEPPGLYIALKELELAMHTNTMAQVVSSYAILAGLGMPVPTPMQAQVDAEGQQRN